MLTEVRPPTLRPQPYAVLEVCLSTVPSRRPAATLPPAPSDIVSEHREARAIRVVQRVQEGLKRVSHTLASVLDSSVTLDGAEALSASTT